MSSPPVMQVAAGLVFHQGRLLICQRPPGGHLAGYWEFPGGKLEPGETFPSALVRELEEELGITVSVGRRLATAEHAYLERTIHLEFYVCQLLVGEPVARGCAAFSWVTAPELANYTFPPADTEVLALAVSAPEFRSPILG